MLLLFDVGNSNIVMGIAEDRKIINTWRIRTNIGKTADEYAIIFNSYLKDYSIKCVIISSVVPQITEILSEYADTNLSLKPLIVGQGIKTGLNITLHNPKEIGADLVAGAIGGIIKYKTPLIIIDLGTATTFSVVVDNVFHGGVILPGVETSLYGLVQKTSLLPTIDFNAPDKVTGKSTVQCMQSGIIYGTASMIDGMIDRITNEHQMEFTVIATGGLAKVIAPHCKTDIILDRNLILDGLIELYYKNK